MNKLIVAVLLILATNTSFGQLSTGGEPLSFKYNFADPEVYRLDFIDNELEILKDTIFRDSLKKPESFFGKSVPIKRKLEDLGRWEQTPDGSKIWRITFQSPSALLISVVLEEVFLPGQGELFFYNADRTIIKGAYPASSQAEDRKFICPFIAGNTITIEYNAPAEEKTLPSFNVREVIHGYKSIWVPDGSGGWTHNALDCHNNVVCDEFNDYCNEIRSVCVIVTSWHFYWENCNGVQADETKWKGGSGALINNSYNDFTPYVFTARHVVWDKTYLYWCLLNFSETHTYTNLDETIFFFNYQSPRCDGDDHYPEPYDFSMRGASAVASMAGTPVGPDLALLRLHDVPPIQYNVFYSGWNRQGKDDLPSWNMTGIHHPRIDLKKISKGNLHYSLATSNYWKVDWHNGVTEEGSSGSPLFNDGDRRIVGALSFGPNDDCNDEDEQDHYGRLRDFWNDVKGNLSPDDHGRETYEGADPATFCQRDIWLNGRVLPCAEYHENRPSMTIQAASHIYVANSADTRIENTWSNRSKYDLRAGNSIQITPNNTVFETDLGSVLILEIAGCRATTGCEIDFNTERKENTPEVVEPKWIDAFAKQEPVRNVIYPNPNTGTFTIDLPGKGEHIVRVLNAVGTLVYETKLAGSQKHQVKLDEKLPAGNYLVHITNGSMRHVEKIMIAR